MTAALQLTKILACCPEFIRAKRIAFYLPNDGEISPLHALHQAWKMRKQTFLPAITQYGGRGKNSMQFVRYRRQDPLYLGAWGLSEPKKNHRIVSLHSLDLILVPLVAFDFKGNRLGRGGGYYDRYLAQSRNSHCKKPFLLGLAHQCQQAESLPINDWDIPLQAIATDKKLIRAAKY